MSETAAGAPFDPIGFLRTSAPWLFAPELGVCVVGSMAAAAACRQAGIPGPRPEDLDLSWALAREAGASLLQQHGVLLPTTSGNQERGTLAMKVGGRRIEITSLRGNAADSSIGSRIAADLGERDMTIGAIAVEITTGRIHDPHRGLDDWRRRRVAPVGDAAQRVREHPIRWLRYFRKAHELGFAIDPRIRAIDLPCTLLHELPPEAIALELRAVFGKCASPGRCLFEMHEVGLLEPLSPELARQFDGRPAGPVRHHPEISQALHLVLALEWAVTNTAHLDPRDAIAVRIAVACHDLGKSYTRASDLPSHPGHDQDGLRWVERCLDRWPGFADRRTRTLALHVCALHLQVRQWEQLRSGTLARMYETWFRANDYPVDLFALAVAADSAGRLGLADTGAAEFAKVRANVEWLRTTCGGIDAAALRARHGEDIEAFRLALHEARARAIAAARREDVTSPDATPS